MTRPINRTDGLRAQGSTTEPPGQAKRRETDPRAASSFERVNEARPSAPPVQVTPAMVDARVSSIVTAGGASLLTSALSTMTSGLRSVSQALGHPPGQLRAPPRASERDDDEDDGVAMRLDDDGLLERGELNLRFELELGGTTLILDLGNDGNGRGRNNGSLRRGGVTSPSADIFEETRAVVMRMPKNDRDYLAELIELRLATLARLITALESEREEDDKRRQQEEQRRRLQEQLKV